MEVSLANANLPCDDDVSSMKFNVFCRRLRIDIIPILREEVPKGSRKGKDALSSDHVPQATLEQEMAKPWSIKQHKLNTLDPSQMAVNETWVHEKEDASGRG